MIFPDINAQTLQEFIVELQPDHPNVGAVLTSREVADLPVTSAVGMRAVMLTTLALPLGDQLAGLDPNAAESMYQAVGYGIEIALFG